MRDADEQQTVIRTRPLGVKLLAAFFVFGAAMCALTIALLAFPGTSLDALWRLNPEAHRAFGGIGAWAFALMAAVGAACLLAAIGLARRAEWGRRLAIIVLAVNLLGDTANAVVRRDWRTLIGVPVGGLLIAFLAGRKTRALFR